MFRRYLSLSSSAVLTSKTLERVGVGEVVQVQNFSSRRRTRGGEAQMIMDRKEGESAASLDPRLLDYAQRKMKELIEQEIHKATGVEPPKKVIKPSNQLSSEERLQKLAKPQQEVLTTSPPAVIGAEPKPKEESKKKEVAKSPIRWESTGVIGKRKFKLETALNTLVSEQIEDLRPTIFVPTTGMSIRMQQMGDSTFYFDGSPVVMKSITDLKDGAAGELTQVLSFLRRYSPPTTSAAAEAEVGGDLVRVLDNQASASASAMEDAASILSEHQWYWQYPNIVEISEAYGQDGVDILRRQEVIWAAFKSLNDEEEETKFGESTSTTQRQLVQLLEQATRTHFLKDYSSSSSSSRHTTPTPSTTTTTLNSYQYGAAQKIIKETYRPVLKLAYLDYENRIIERAQQQLLAMKSKEEGEHKEATTVDLGAEPLFQSSSARRSKVARESWHNDVLEAELGISPISL